MRTSVSMVLVVLLLVPAVPRAQAQTAHAAPQAALDAALRQHTADAAGDREVVLRVLERAEVKTVAGRMGVDLRRAEGAIATLSEQDLAQRSLSQFLHCGKLLEKTFERWNDSCHLRLLEHDF